MSQLRTWLQRPLAENFDPWYQAKLSMQAGLYVFVFLHLFINYPADASPPRWVLLGSLGLACAVASWLANAALPRLFSQFYDEDTWTIGRHSLHVLFVLLFVTAGNMGVLLALNLPRPSFWSQYLTVAVVGILPITIGVMIAERRRLTRNLAHAQQNNRQLDQLHQPTAPNATAEPVLPKGILLTGESGKDRLSLLPNQLVYVESVGNYVEVHWLNFMFPQKTVLRSTLKDVEAALTDQPQFFRCHRAFLVNLRAVSHTTGNSRGYQLILGGSNREIPVSRTYLSAFDARMEGLAQLPSHP